jgi:hypothetical protein
LCWRCRVGVVGLGFIAKYVTPHALHLAGVGVQDENSRSTLVTFNVVHGFFFWILILTPVPGDVSVKVTMVHFASLAATAVLHTTQICTLGP